MQLAGSRTGIDELMGRKEITRLVLRDPDDLLRRARPQKMECKGTSRENLIYLESASAAKRLRISRNCSAERLTQTTSGV